jgi:hypothetical protein
VVQIVVKLTFYLDWTGMLLDARVVLTLVQQLNCLLVSPRTYNPAISLHIISEYFIISEHFILFCYDLLILRSTAQSLTEAS